MSPEHVVASGVSVEVPPRASRLARDRACNYRIHMATIKLKVARIGNSRGIRLPAASLRRYRIGEVLLMEERSDGILLRPTGPAVQKLSWDETAREMAASSEDWSEWDSAVSDGLEHVLWEARAQSAVEERPTRYRTKRRSTRRR